jgi:hypothetical protein
MPSMSTSKNELLKTNRPPDRYRVFLPFLASDSLVFLRVRLKELYG